MASLGEVLVFFHWIERGFSIHLILFQAIFCLLKRVAVQDMRRQMAPKIFHQRIPKTPPPPPPLPMAWWVLSFSEAKAQLWLEPTSPTIGLSCRNSVLGGDWRERLTTDEGTVAPSEAKQEHQGATSCPLWSLRLSHPLLTRDLKAAGRAWWAFLGGELKGGGSGSRRKWP